jgi:hypothetical protein
MLLVHFWFGGFIKRGNAARLEPSWRGTQVRYVGQVERYKARAARR